MADPVLLTGATGFVGRAVLAELTAKGFPVHAVAHRKPGADLPGVTWHLADLLDSQSRADLIHKAPAGRLIHCAWYVEHGAFWTSPLNEVWTEASEDLARLFLEEGGRRIMALGSCAEYARQAEGDGKPWPETRPIVPTSPYGRAKADLHQRLVSLCETTEGATLIWARLFHLYGPGEPPARLVPSLIASLGAERPAEVRAERLVRDFASTRHVARCIVALMDTEASGAFNVGSGTCLTLGQMAQIIAELFGRPDLLCLSHNPPRDEADFMAPNLSRLQSVLGPRIEDPSQGLRELASHLHPVLISGLRGQPPAN